MKAVKRWRYYCDFCKKAGQSGFHMKNHESSCTMNPQRQCKLCAHLNGGNGTPLPEMLALLPDPAQFIDRVPSGDFYDSYDDDERLRAAVHASLPALRELTEDCPVCILAALRQRGIPVPVVTAFNFTEEMKSARIAMNDMRAENQPGYYL